MSTMEWAVTNVRNGKGRVDSILASVREYCSGDTLTALLLAVNVFTLLASYYVLKTVREALILSESGAAVKSYSSAGQALLLLGVIPAYGYLASRVNRFRLNAWVTVFFVSHLVIFYLLGSAGVKVGVAFFLWLGIFNVLVIAQFWSFANDVNDSKSGARMFPLIGIGSALGAWVGARAAGRLFEIFTPYQLMMLAGGGLLLTLVFALVVEKRSQHRPSAPISGKGGFRLVLSSRFLLFIAVMVLLFNMVNSLGEFMLGRIVVENMQAAVAAGSLDASEMQSAIGAFYGDFFGWVNLLGLLIQTFIVSKLFKYIGVGGALLVVPLIALGSYGLMAALPILGIVKAMKVLENSADYSIQNTARHALFLPASREAKYKAKAAIDTFFWRLGDLAQAGIVLAGSYFALTTRQYASVNIVLVAVWLVVVIGIYREHKRMAQS